MQWFSRYNCASGIGRIYYPTFNSWLSCRFSYFRLVNDDRDCLDNFLIGFFDPLTPTSDQDRISPYNIN